MITEIKKPKEVQENTEDTSQKVKQEGKEMENKRKKVRKLNKHQTEIPFSIQSSREYRTEMKEKKLQIKSKKTYLI